MRRRIVLVCVAFSVLFVPAASAVEMGLGLRAGTQGYGLEYGVEIVRWFGVRGAGYWAEFSADYDDGGNTYEGTLKLGGYGLFADFYPARNSFRISAGILRNGNRFEVVGKPAQNQEIGGVDYTPAQIGSLAGDIKFDSPVVYLGIGSGRFTGGRRVGFLFDFGAIRQGSGRVGIGETTCVLARGPE